MPLLSVTDPGAGPARHAREYTFLPQRTGTRRNQGQFTQVDAVLPAPLLSQTLTETPHMYPL